MELGLDGPTAIVTVSYGKTGMIVARHLEYENAGVLVHDPETGQTESAL